MLRAQRCTFQAGTKLILRDASGVPKASGTHVVYGVVGHFGSHRPNGWVHPATFARVLPPAGTVKAIRAMPPTPGTFGLPVVHPIPMPAVHGTLAADTGTRPQCWAGLGVSVAVFDAAVLRMHRRP